MIYLFDVPAFFIIFRETLECTLILSVLLGYIDKMIPMENRELKQSLRKRIWIGVCIGIILSLVIGAIFIGVFYAVANSRTKSEEIWSK